MKTGVNKLIYHYHSAIYFSNRHLMLYVQYIYMDEISKIKKKKLNFKKSKIQDVFNMKHLFMFMHVSR